MNTSTGNSTERAEEKETLQKQRESFVTSLSHDLKNPTIAQIRALELILKGKFGTVAPELREIMEMLLDSCKYMNAMLGSVLTTYRISNGTINLNSDKLSIAELAAECIDEMVYLAKDKDIKIIYTNSAEKDSVYGDALQIRRVIMNFLSNGIKYAYPKTELKINVYNEDNYTCFSFENKSSYLPPEKQKKLFNRYISFAQSCNGVGLGLYSSKKIFLTLF